MDRLNNKLDAISADITEIKVLVAKNSTVLERNVEDIAQHIRRTALLEQQMNTAMIPTKIFKWFLAIIPFLAFMLTVSRYLQSR